MTPGAVPVPLGDSVPLLTRMTPLSSIRFHVVALIAVMQVGMPRQAGAQAGTQRSSTARTDEMHAAAATLIAADTATDLRAAARRVIQAAGHAAFITLDATGHPRARTVQPLAPDSSMVVWFATNPRTRKVDDVSRDGRVSLYYFDPASLAYVTLVGRARIVRERAEQDRHWERAWDAFYPDRAKGVVLVEVTPEYLEVVDIKRGVRGDSVSWRPPTVQLRPPARRQ